MRSYLCRITLKLTGVTGKRLTELPGVGRGENTSTWAIRTKSDILAHNVELFNKKSLEAI